MFLKLIEYLLCMWQVIYQGFVLLVLIMWLLFLIVVVVFLVKLVFDFVVGNYWGMLLEFMGIENYICVFIDSLMLCYILNFFVIMILIVIGVVGLVCMIGFVLGIYKFCVNLIIFFMFIVGNFVLFQILMVLVCDLIIDMGLYNIKGGLILFYIVFQMGFCILFMCNFICVLLFELIEVVWVEGVVEWCIFWYVVLLLMKFVIVVLVVLVFIFIWNDYFWVVVLI